MEHGEVYFLKMNNGEDLLVQLIGDEHDCLWITQPYRVELMPSHSTMTVATSIMRWIPFESLMEEKVRIDKTNVLTYMMVDSIVAEKYLNTINDQYKEQANRIKQRQAQMTQQLLAMVGLAANNSGSLH